MRRILLMFFANLFRLPYMMIKVFHMAHHPDKYSKEARYACLHQMVRYANRGGRVVVDAEGMENLPKDSSFILYPNHQGMYDVLSMLEAIDVPFSPIAKKETEKVLMLGSVLKMLDAEFMDREDIRQSLHVITTAAARSKQGDNFVIFAEGTRSKNGNELLPFKPGAFKAATLSKAAIVPVALIDSFIPFDRPSLKKTTVKLRILPAIPYEEYKGMTTPQIAEIVQLRIKTKIDESLE